MTPILRNHDSKQPIGFVREVDGNLCVEFAADTQITRELAFEVFGNCGMLVLESSNTDGVMLIRKAQILEFSLEQAMTATTLVLDLYKTGGRHPIDVMRGFGIAYASAEPQPIADQWMFFDCKNAPEPLPECLRVAGQRID